MKRSGRLLSKVTSFVLVFMLVLTVLDSELLQIHAKSMAPRSTAQIIVDYNRSIGTGNPYLFGGGGFIPGKEEDQAWESLKNDFGLKIVKVEIDLKKLFPTDENTMDSDVLNDYAHVAGSILSRINGSDMQAMLEFAGLPSWLDADGDKKYDNLVKYQAILEKVYTTIKNTWKDTKKDLIQYVEIKPDSSLNDADFIDTYFSTAQVIRSIDPDVIIGGPGYEITGKNDIFDSKVKALLNFYRDFVQDSSLFQFFSVRACDVDSGGGEKDIFGEFKNGRKVIRNQSGNADLPLFMTGWTTSRKGANTADDKITGIKGISQHTSALMKGMRDGWSLVLFQSMSSDRQSPASYAFTYNDNDSITAMPFAKTYQLLNCLKLNTGEFNVVPADMGDDLALDDAIAMMNHDGDAAMLLSNFSTVKNEVTVELRNVPYEDGDVAVDIYVAADGKASLQPGSPLYSIPAKVVNGSVDMTIPNIPVGAAGIMVREGINRDLEARRMYEFESQDNLFGGNTEITWTNGASFHRTVQGFGGENNFVALRKVQADGDGSYTAKLYLAEPNPHVMAEVNGDTAIEIDTSDANLNIPAEFRVDLNAGGQNTIKFYTVSGELKPDCLVLVPENVKLSVGFQNLSQLIREVTDGVTKYVLPLDNKNYTPDARIYPQDLADGMEITYSSSDESCAVIDKKSGLITPLSEGETVISAQIVKKESDGNVLTRDTASSSFLLKIKSVVSEIKIDPESLYLQNGQEGTIHASVLPEHVSNKNIEWSLSGSGLEVVEKDHSKIVVRAVGDGGLVRVTAKAEDGGLSKSCLVTVGSANLGGSIKADFGSTIATGYPGIFGMTHYPNSNPSDPDIGSHTQVWNMLKESGGVTFVRADARLQEILPVWTKKENTGWARPEKGTFDPNKQPDYVISELYYVEGPDGLKRQFSVDGYQQDMEYFNENGQYLNGMSNPDNWNTGRLLRWIRNAKQTGLEVMVMTFQIPEWLAGGYPLPGAPHTEKACNSAPKDWDIYRDIIKKVYKILKEEGVNYYEFLNEPHWYVPKGGNQKNPDGNAYTGTGAAFANAVAADQFYQAIDAIYEYEQETTGNHDARPQMLLGGGADDSWGGSYGVLGTMLSGQYKNWMGRIDFVSIHKYGERPANENNSNNGANARNLKHWLKEKTGRNISLFLNEYNISTGQPAEETYGVKSIGWHTKNLIDMMTDEFRGGGYYTCYPADVPMDDYEASKGWIERGKGMYTWNNGNPYLATFTKAWDLMSDKLGLGRGEFLVKATDIGNSGMTQGVSAVNQEGNPVVIVNNYNAKSYGSTEISLIHLPYEEHTVAKAYIYGRTMETPVDETPVVKEITIGNNGTASLILDSVPAYGVAGIVVKGISTVKEDCIYEMESYRNTWNGNARINIDDAASNGRWIVGAEGPSNSVKVPVSVLSQGIQDVKLRYFASQPAKLHISINEGQEMVIHVPGNGILETVSFSAELKRGSNSITIYTSADDVKLDVLEIGG